MERDLVSRWRSGRHGGGQGGRRPLALTLLLLALLLAACQDEGEGAPDAADEARTGASEDPASDGTTSPDAALYADAMQGVMPNEEYAAALRATKFLIDAAPTLDQAWAMTTYEHLYRIAPTEGLARRLKALYDEAIARPMLPLPERLDSPRLLEAGELRPIVLELWRRRMAGAEWKQPAAALEALLVENEDEFWRPISPIHQLVFLYLFQNIGIETRRTKEDVARELHERWANGDRNRLLLDPTFMYGMTHVIYVDSAYGDRLLDPADHPIDVEILDAALARYAARLPGNPMFIHLAFEVLAGRRFLQLPDTEQARVLKRKLLRLQDESGCWRPGAGTDTIHATQLAVQALGRFPPELRRLEPLPPPTQ